jgi:hypothetical protein
MSVGPWAFGVLDAWAATLASSSVMAETDPGCQVSEVSRLLWTVIVLATAAGLFVAARPTWHTVAALAAADLVWLWVDMEGPVLLSRGTHGLHLADVPVVISLPALAIGAGRLLARRRSTR